MSRSNFTDEELEYFITKMLEKKYDERTSRLEKQVILRRIAQHLFNLNSRRHSKNAYLKKWSDLKRHKMAFIKEVRDRNCPGATLPKVRPKRSNKMKVVVVEEELMEDEEDEEQEQEQAGPSGHQAHSPPEADEVQENEEEEEQDEVVTTPHQEELNRCIRKFQKMRQEQLERMKQLRANQMRRMREQKLQFSHEITVMEMTNQKAFEEGIQELIDMKRLP
ncbi:ABC transporter F family member 4-like [Bufo gargarizans]|uniref:ABC transporter F family member 4-like n=1 Tax=Bufo gargarizans TaxID=30331 RepID=UPI001CF4E32D|nr:ABC transporter F family member 4-like [Bufo gargarizans]